MRIGFIIFLLTLVFTTCKKDLYETQKREIGLEYVNQTQGHSIVYEVEEITFDDFTNTSDTLQYQIMTKNDTFYFDNTFKNVLRHEKYKRLNDSDLWYFQEAYYSKLNEEKYEVIENNTRYIKLSFPISSDAFWNSNAFNIDNNSFVYYATIKGKTSINQTHFQNIVTIKFDPIINSVRERIYEETYAKDIGLIKMNKAFIEKNNNTLRGYKLKYSYLYHEN
jgi:hypothetical protein